MKGPILICDDSHISERIKEMIKELAGVDTHYIISNRRSYLSDFREPKENHPDGWYRKFEKPNKRK